MSEQAGTAQLDALVADLAHVAAQLRAEDLDAHAAAVLVERCAGLAAQASGELERLARAAANEPLPGQDSLM